MEGFAHVLLTDFGEELSPEASGYVRRFIESGRKAERLIGDLLEHSALSFRELRLERVELGAVVDATLASLVREVEAADADVAVEGPLPAVHGHQGTLVQVLGNLLSNALKFVPDDVRPTVRIRVRDRGPRVRVSVEDNGMGIPPEKADRIFRVFERLVESGDRPGTGIGLAIVRRAMERMGRASGVESDGASWSRFWIENPSARPAGPGSSRRPGSHA